ncbi:MAG: hypothetical protein NC830_05090 [Candidatus Omnitrophica bacterium]|nr:hypothetical protein [Candidatus Omnitrophota bacterium]
MYLGNAQKLIIERKLAKASELLWGTIVELIKALGVLYGLDPSRLKHKEIVDTGKRIALELDDIEMSRLVDNAQAFHANFYEDFMSEEVFGEHYKAIIELIKKLLNILTQKRAEFAIRP